MLKRIELWDFEAHEHTVVDDLSQGLNLICGESNAGKTSIVRALKLAAYNEFDPRSVRTGKTKCKVLVETDRGTVLVVRGPKHNHWEVTKNGQRKEEFDKVGVNVVPEAAEVLGLNMVKLGDVDVPVNIMDQLESHFLLSSVGGEKASGSIRAQIVDEISGLSGIEGLIKDVSLDNHRFGREVKETEDAMEETRKQLHNEAELQHESEVLTQAESELKEADDCKTAAESGMAILDSWNQTVEAHNAVMEELNALPDAEAAKKEIQEALAILPRATKAQEMFDEWMFVQDSKKRVEAALAGLPDAARAIEELGEAKKQMERLVAAETLLSEYDRVKGQCEALDEQLASMKDTASALKELELAKQAMDRAVAIQRVIDEARDVERQLGEKQAEIEACEKELEDAMRERDEMMKSITVCPLTLKPVSKECLEGTNS